MGGDVLTVTQLKVMQEVVTLTTFAIFAFFVFNEKPTTNHLIAFILLIGACYFATNK